MTQGVETRLEGTTLVVRIPMRFQRRGGRKRIVAPDGSELAPATKPQPDGTLVKALARAWRCQRMLEEGPIRIGQRSGEAERVGLSYISRVLRLTLLAPDIVEAFLNGRPTAGLAQLLKPFPIAWERQREMFGCQPNQMLDADRGFPSAPACDDRWADPEPFRRLDEVAGLSRQRHRRVEMFGQRPLLSLTCTTPVR